MKYVLSRDDMIFESKFGDFVRSIIRDNKGSIDKTVKAFNKFSSTYDGVFKKKLIKYFFALLVSAYSFQQVSDYMKKDVPVEKTQVVHHTKPITPQPTIRNFMKDIGSSESSNRWNIKKGQYLGYFQLGRVALEDIGVDYDKLNKKKFLNNREMQTDCFVQLLKNNKKYLRDVLDEWQGKTINGIKVTESGVLAAAHLIGYKNVKKFFSSDGEIIAKDGNGVPLTDYLKKFAGYKLNLENN